MLPCRLPALPCLYRRTGTTAAHFAENENVSFYVWGETGLCIKTKNVSRGLQTYKLLLYAGA